jgi:biopolymer transport protein ExbD
VNRFTSILPRILVLGAALLAVVGPVQAADQQPPALAVARNKLTVDPSNYVIIIERDQSAKTDRIVVNGMPVDISDFFHKIQRDFDYSQTDTIIEAAPDVRYGTVLQVMAAANAAGFTGFGLATRQVNSRDVAGKITGFQKNVGATNHAAHNRAAAVANVEVLVTKTSIVWIDNKRTPLSVLYSAAAHTVDLERKHSFSGAAPHISLTADTEAPWQTIVLILDAFRQAADDNIGFVTE